MYSYNNRSIIFSEAKCLIQFTFQLFLLFHYYFWDHRLRSARDQIVVVPSTFSFSTTVAEQFGRNTEFKTPIAESTGSGGLKLFCAGIGLEHPMSNASRRIKKSEFDNCNLKVLI